MEDLILLDTGILFEFLAGRNEAEIVFSLLSEHKASVAAITVYELFRGVTSEKHGRLRSKLLQFVHVYNLDTPIARRAAEIYSRLKSQGNLIDNEDILISATAIHHKNPVFTMNAKHFSRIPGIHLFDE